MQASLQVLDEAGELRVLDEAGELRARRVPTFRWLCFLRDGPEEHHGFEAELALKMKRMQQM